MSRRRAALELVGALLLMGGGARAQEASTGIAVERLVPALGPATLVAVEGAAVTPVRAVSWALGLDLQRDPIRLGTRYGEGTVARPVRDQLVVDVGLEVGLWHRLALAVGAPLVAYQDGDRLRGTGVDERPLATTTAGDLRLRLKGQLVGDAARPGLHAALVLQVTAPSLGRHDFAATDGATVEPRLLVDAMLGPLLMAASVGARFAPERTLFLTRFGDELTWSAGAGTALLQRFGFALGALVEAAGAVGPSDGTRPAELRGAVRATLPWLSVDAGAGGGLVGDVGAPAWRIFVVARGVAGLTR